MRPRELTIEGFRSYRGPVTFDWRDRRLVGVVGPIGSGKSTILDAIAFALYGKTPGVAQNTKSLIHQLCDQAHVSLTFEVDGQVWTAVRAPKRVGRSGHQLVRVASDAPDAEVLETVTQETAVNARIEQLLGMDFATFCRSVLLAQNRFSEFLRATPTERDKVLKGVFGYERLDAAKVAAERRFDREDLALEALAREQVTIGQARGQLEDARRRAALAHERSTVLDEALPLVEELQRERSEARDQERLAAERTDALHAVASQLPPGDDVDRTLAAAETANDGLEGARATLAAAEQARAAAEAELALVHERLGDRDQLRSFEKLVDRLTALATARARSAEAADAARADHDDAVGTIDALRERAGETDDASAAADARLAEATEAVASARLALDEARHAEMAHALRGSLVAGDPCPVCTQPVATVPDEGPAPAAVAAASAALERCTADETLARARKDESVAAVGAARTAVSEAETRAAQAGDRATAADEDLRTADAELTAVKDRLADRLGDGEPDALVSALDAELTAAETAVRSAVEEVDRARAALDRTREGADEAHAALTSLNTALAGVWGALGDHRDLEPSPASLRASFVALGEAIIGRLDEATSAGTDAAGRAARADETLASLLEDLGIEPGQDFVAVRADAAALHAAAAAAIEVLEGQLTRADAVEREVLEAESRRALARRLADDLKPSRFLAFLLEEERAELAELGSGLFETLSGGTYRFAEDDTFGVMDLNAAGRTRGADSLSGGETFLASLALALALAEMVARGGGRLDSFFLDEGFGSLDPDHLDRAMDGIGRLVSEDDRRLVVLVSHVAEMRSAIEDLVVLDKDDATGDTVVVAGAIPAGAGRRP